MIDVPNTTSKMTDSRDTALEMVDQGLVHPYDMLVMAIKYMSTDDVADMLDANELSSRFSENEKENT